MCVTRVHDIDELWQRSTACLAWLGAAADWWCSWPMANLCSCQWRIFLTNFVTINFLWGTSCFTPCLMQHLIFKECIIKVWNVMFSFSLDSVSTLFRWGEHFCHMCIKYFFLLTTVQKLTKSIKIFQSYGHKCSATFLWFTVYMPKLSSALIRRCI